MMMKATSRDSWKLAVDDDELMDEQHTKQQQPFIGMQNL